MSIWEWTGRLWCGADDVSKGSGSWYFLFTMRSRLISQPPGSQAHRSTHQMFCPNVHRARLCLPTSCGASHFPKANVIGCIHTLRLPVASYLSKENLYVSFRNLEIIQQGEKTSENQLRSRAEGKKNRILTCHGFDLDLGCYKPLFLLL